MKLRMATFGWPGRILAVAALLGLAAAFWMAVPW